MKTYADLDDEAKGVCLQALAGLSSTELQGVEQLAARKGMSLLDLMALVTDLTDERPVQP